MKNLFITLKNNEHKEIWSSFLKHIDAASHCTILYTKFPIESNTVRLPSDINYITVQDGIVSIYYQNGLLAEIIRK